jgi:hypothetical protein
MSLVKARFASEGSAPALDMMEAKRGVVASGSGSLRRAKAKWAG